RRAGRKGLTDLARSLSCFKVLGVLFLGEVSSVFLPSKKACWTHKFRHLGVGQQYPSGICTARSLSKFHVQQCADSRYNSSVRIDGQSGSLWTGRAHYSHHSSHHSPRSSCWRSHTTRLIVTQRARISPTLNRMGYLLHMGPQRPLRCWVGHARPG